MNPYTVVGSPGGANYGAPLLNFGQLMGLNQQQNPQQNQQGQGQGQSQQLTAQYAQLLQKLFGGGSGGFSGGSVVPQGYNPNVASGLY